MVFECLDGYLYIVCPVIFFGGGNWYLMYMVVISILKSVDASLSIKCNHGLIMKIFLKPVVNSVKARIINLSLLFFIAFIRTTLQAYTYMT